VRPLAAILKEGFRTIGQPVTACIGPQTAAAAKRAGLKPDIIARKHTLSGMLEAIEFYYQKRRK